MSERLNKDGTGCYQMTFGVMVDTVQITVNKDANCRQKLRVRDLQDPKNPLELFSGEITKQTDIFVYFRNKGRQFTIEVCAKWSHPDQDTWYDSDYHVFSSANNSFVIGWDDLTNGPGGHPDSDFNDLRLGTIPIFKQVSTKDLEVFY